MAEKIYRVGAIGFAHQHINHLLDEYAKHPRVEWVACADTVPAVPSLCDKPSTRTYNLRRAHEVIGIPRVYQDYRELLEKEQLDIVIFCPENARHGEVGEAIANKGTHMVTEKPMAATLPDAIRMVRAARRNGVKLMVNWPTTWRPATRAVKTLIDQGVIGEVWEVKHRNGGSLGPLTHGAVPLTDAEKGAEWWHQSAAGGGALLDYCCYGACLARWYLDQPATAVLGLKANIRSHYGDAEDNAVLTVRFPKGLAVLEATWSSDIPGVPSGPIVFGTEGTLVVNRGVVEVHTVGGRAAPVPRIVEGDPLPVGRETLAEEFFHHLETGEPLHPTLDPLLNLEMMAILDAGIRSAASGKMELVNDMHWCIG